MDAPASNFAERVSRTLREQCGIAPDVRVLVAVSGGPDSVALVHLLEAAGQPCVVGHIDHGLRPESREDAVFVRALAERLGLPYAEQAIDAESLAEHSADSVEMAARSARYDALAEMARTHEAVAIATAHHADDQAETILMRILRGASPKGLAGIPVCGEWKGMPVVRPLLHVTRPSIMNYLLENAIDYREDASNAESIYLRNRVRNELLPQLERDYNRRLRDALRKLGTTQRIENEFLEHETDGLRAACLTRRETIGRHAFAKAHEALQHRLIAGLLADAGVDVDFDRVRGAAESIADGAVGKRFDAGGGMTFVNGRNETRVEYGEERQAEMETLELVEEGETHAFGCVFRIRALDAPPDNLQVYCTPERQVLDADAVGGGLVARHAREGDRFRPMGLGGTKKLSDYFSELGLPRWERPEQIVIESESRILWVVGGAIDESAAVGPATARCIEIQVIREAE